ncbi:MAG: hypothetical protein ACR2HZ_00090 [Gemmatimonadaceae bacterium]
MHQSLKAIRNLLFGAVVLTGLGFGASVALARPVMVCDNPPVVVGSCQTPGFDCQLECDLWNGEGNTTGVCAPYPETQGCCFCVE